MKRFFIFTAFILTMLSLSLTVNAEVLKNAGFAGNTILIQNSTPTAGETVRLSMPLYNESKGIISGTVRLYQDENKIAEKTVSLKTGEFSGVSFEWKAVSGTHNFKLRFEDTQIQNPKSSKEIVILEKREALLTVNVQGGDSEGALFKEYPIVSEVQQTPDNSGIDSYRQDILSSAENKINSIKKDIGESIKANEEYEERLSELRSSLPRADGSLLTPVEYLYAWFLGALAFVLSNTYLFYGVSVLIIFLLLRFIIRRFTHHHRHLHHLHK